MEKSITIRIEVSIIISYFNRKAILKNQTKLWAVILFLLGLGGANFLGCSSAPQFTTLTHTASPTQIPLPIIVNLRIDLGILIADMEKTMPLANTEGFIIPSKSDRQVFQDIVKAIEANTPDLIAQTVPAYNYEILRISDQGDSWADSFILREQTPIMKGWGLYAFRIQSPRNIIIEAPHPLADKKTPEIAIGLYQALQARALLVSGAHRNANKDGSADGAHASESIFQTVHETLFQLQSNSNDPAIFIQVHGFASNGHPHYPQVVLGHNWKDDPEKDKLLEKIAKALQANHIKVGICNGNNLPDLCGTENIQGSITQNGIFIHLELNEKIRNNASVLVASFKQALNP